MYDNHFQKAFDETDGRDWLLLLDLLIEKANDIERKLPQFTEYTLRTKKFLFSVSGFINRRGLPTEKQASAIRKIEKSLRKFRA